ncbi:MAG TPA: OB-fold domain-containing protein [Mycobacteriales bacterium]|nr:OB-fold domain-containing protein [Mycobacteriales bacterium]
MIEEVPLPNTEDPDAAPFWEHALRGELAVQVCADCHARRNPPRPMCPVCNSLGLRWEVLSGRGRIWSFVVAHPPLLPAFLPVAPYNVVVVEAEEDPTLRFVGNLVAEPGAPINSVEPTTIAIGQEVVVAFERVADDVALPRFVGL